MIIMFGFCRKALNETVKGETTVNGETTSQDGNTPGPTPGVTAIVIIIIVVIVVAIVVMAIIIFIKYRKQRQVRIQEDLKASNKETEMRMLKAEA